MVIASYMLSVLYESKHQREQIRDLCRGKHVLFFVQSDRF